MQVEEITLGKKVLLNVCEIPYWAGNCAIPHELTLYNDRAVSQWVKFRKNKDCEKYASGVIVLREAIYISHRNVFLHTWMPEMILQWLKVSQRNEVEKDIPDIR